MFGEWVRVTRCPICGGPLTISEFHTCSREYKITKSGVLSKRFSVHQGGNVEATTMYCEGCEKAWDDSQVAVETDGTVWVNDDT